MVTDFEYYVCVTAICCYSTVGYWVTVHRWEVGYLR